MKHLVELFKLFSIISIASLGVMKEGWAVSRKVTATPDGIIIQEIPKCAKNANGLKPEAKQCTAKVRSVFIES